jgi:hypothetical protein
VEPHRPGDQQPEHEPDSCQVNEIHQIAFRSNISISVIHLRTHNKWSFV